MVEPVVLFFFFGLFVLSEVSLPIYAYSLFNRNVIIFLPCAEGRHGLLLSRAIMSWAQLGCKLRVPHFLVESRKGRKRRALVG